MTADDAGSDSTTSDLNPYHPPTSSDDTRDRPPWLPIIWNMVLISISTILMLAMFGVVGWIAARSAESGSITGAMLLQLASIAQISLFYLLFLLSLSTPFWRERGFWWRAVYVAETIALLFDFDWLQPTRQSIFVTLIFIILVLPVLTHGYGWIGAAIHGWRRFSQGQREEEAL